MQKSLGEPEPTEGRVEPSDIEQLDQSSGRYAPQEEKTSSEEPARKQKAPLNPRNGGARRNQPASGRNPPQLPQPRTWMYHSNPPRRKCTFVAKRPCCL